MTANNIINFPTNTEAKQETKPKKASRYVSTSDKAKLIREALKKHKWSSRKVSVKVDTYSMGSSIDITIKDPSVDDKTVETIAKQFESIDYCEVTQEILSGGNTYIHVNTTKDVDDERRKPFIEASSVVSKQIDADRMVRYPLGDTGITVIRWDDKNVEMSFDGKSRTVYAYNFEDNTNMIALVAYQLTK